LRKIFGFVLCFITGFFFISCVTTEENTGKTPLMKVAEEEISEKSDVPAEKKGIIYSSRQMNDGPLLLGSKDHMSGPVVEFSILYSLYFPLSGILIPDNEYKISEGTRWQINSVKFEESVFFERALLSEDDHGNSWWYLLVEGDGYRREFEFMLDPGWTLQEMRYFDEGTIKTYYPSVDEVRDLSNGAVDYRGFKSGRETIKTDSGTYLTDHIFMESREYWMNNSVTGSFVQSVIKEDNEIVVTATLLEEKENYKTIMESF